MVDTGYISFITQTGGGGQDANGNPVSAVKSASDFVPCNLSVVTKEYKSYVDGVLFSYHLNPSQFVLCGL